MKSKEHKILQKFDPKAVDSRNFYLKFLRDYVNILIHLLMTFLLRNSQLIAQPVFATKIVFISASPAISEFAR